MKKIEPLKLTIYKIRDDMLKGRKPITNVTTFEPNGYKFSEDGLYSTEIFGAVGSKNRKLIFGYIKLNCHIINPKIYHIISKLGNRYLEILSGKTKAIFKNNDFVLDEEGETGFTFFMSKIDTIKFVKNESIIRNDMIDKFNTARKLDLVTAKYWPVSPAGYRDYETDDDGRPMDNEINDLYRKLISISNTLINVDTSGEDKDLFDNSYFRINKIIMDIYLYYVKDNMDGKNKLIQGKVMKRAVTGGTRNVFISAPTEIKDLRDTEDIPTIDDTVIGIFQYVKCISPKIKYYIKKHIIDSRIDMDSGYAFIFDDNYKPLQYEMTEEDMEIWGTFNGMETMFNKFKKPKYLNSTVLLGNKYPLLLIGDEDETITVYDYHSNMDDVDVKKLRPITYGEMIYISSKLMNELTTAMITRFPIEGDGSSYPSLIHLTATIEKLERTIKMNSDEVKVKNYPKYDSNYLIGMVPHISKLKEMGGDFDGDKGDLNASMLEDSTKETLDYLDNMKKRISPTGSMYGSMDTGVTSFLFKTIMTDM